MEQAFIKGFCFGAALAAMNLLPTSASAVTLSYEYSGTGSADFGSETTLNLGGSCSSSCVISAMLTMSGTGPAPSATSGWAGQTSATILDNLGDSLHLAVNAGDIGTNHTTFGGVLFPAVLPATLDISTLSLASFLGGPGTIDYSLSINLPAGAYVTPLPDTLTLFATGLGFIGMFALWGRRRKASRLKCLW
jgi:hypothetical protein